MPTRYKAKTNSQSCRHGHPRRYASRLAMPSARAQRAQRVYGPDLLYAACERSLTTGWKHYFYGGAPGVVEKLGANLEERFPRLPVAGWDTPPFRPLTQNEDRAAVEKINSSGADIVWVGLGAPKQEFWMAEHLGKVKAPVMIGVGAAFDFHAGFKSRRPAGCNAVGLSGSSAWRLSRDFMEALFDQ